MNKSPEDQKQWAEFRKYFERFVVSDIEKSLKADIEVGTIILTAIGIDCLSGYNAGKPTKNLYLFNLSMISCPDTRLTH